MYFLKVTIQEGIKFCIYCLKFFKKTEIYSFSFLEPGSPKSRCQGIIKAKFALKVLGKNTSLPLAVSHGPRHYLAC